MGRERTKENIEQILSDYANGLTMKQLHSKYKVCAAAVKKWTIEHNVYKVKRNSISEGVLSKATNDYINGMLMKEVETKYSITCPVIYKYMKQKGIKYTNEHGRRHTVNKEFFNIIDTERKAYWLGFIMADGCITKVSQTDKNPNRFSFNVSSKDIEHLKTFNSDIESTYKITEIIPKGTYSENPMCRLSINSIEFVANLMKHGICERKTGKEHIPSSVPEDLVCHFIRGFLDGDGFITLKGYIGFCGPKGILEQIIKLFPSLNYSLKKETRKECDIWYLVYSGKNSRDTLSSYLYKSASVYLHRKFLNLCS
jgi:hypothetical protein